MLFLAAAASALNLPTPRGLDARASTSTAAMPFGRREMIATAGSAFAAVVTASAASAYDAIPVVEADFAAAEKARKEREALAKKRTDSLLTKLRPLEAATSEAEFVEVQGTGEAAPYGRADLDRLVSLAEKGIVELIAAQRRALV